tara:strand:- start:3025 stop:3471 length:447 start_codon:yes stop_codon:yes gene_type:complete
MPDKKPLKANLTGAGNLESLAEFEDGDFIDVDDGGTGRTSFNANEILIGNGTSGIDTISRGNLIAGSTKIIINNGTSATEVLLGSNVTIDIVESAIDINKTTGQIPLSRLLEQTPGTVDVEFDTGAISGNVPLPDENGNINYIGEEFD